ncbi:adenosine kinase [Pelagicoccus sp. SDUM812002]|uniref:adenosine kinase n=1 Tax=Pelagicoccus sp. SDUM812002 TaxID=3041266 RepID=UPI00280F04BD|nr:adenosine kinase [Pelagicoccus sp. SDUM812002]MDQ8187271.1 adenosine kinase [Pelagicoccus sp. SDUM812002]
MAKKYNVYGMGNALVDIVTEVDDAFFAANEIEKGVMTLVDEARQSALVSAIDLDAADKQCGGSAANSIIGAAQFGARTFYSCKVANDELGHFYLTDLKANGADTNLTIDTLPEGITGKCLVMTTPDAERTMNTFLGVTATYSTEQIDEAALADSEYLYIEGYLVTSSNGVEAMKIARDKAAALGIKTALTFSDPAMVKYFGDAMKEVVGDGIDLLFCNEEEAMIYTGTDSVPAAVEAMKSVAKQFAVTLGPDGALIWDGESEIKIDPVPTEAVDTNGAGDLFAGAFLYGVTHGLSLSDAGALASRASSAVVSKFGPRLSKAQAQALL